MPRILQNLSDPNVLLKKREEREEIRQKEGRPHEVFYFHELLDPYSHITSQLIGKLSENYDIELIPLIVGEPPSKTVHEPSLYRKYCLADAIRIAPFHGCEFPSSKLPNDNVISLAQRILCGLEREEFISALSVINDHVWSGDL
jgi:2-hydroxychromene-2-carboxylate isomerase